VKKLFAILMVVCFALSLTIAGVGCSGDKKTTAGSTTHQDE